MGKAWIGVDLDGTLAEYHGWVDVNHIGTPIPAMVERVKKWLDEGIEVRIMTARISGPVYQDNQIARHHIRNWTETHLGARLTVTCSKDLDMIQLWDDRAIQVETNTGRLVFGLAE